MKKKIIILLITGVLLIMASCSKENSDSNKDILSKEVTTETKDFQVTDASSSDLKGTPDSQLSPEIEGKIVDDLPTYNDLSHEEKNALIKDYLFKALSGLTTSESETIELLEDKGYSESDLENLSDIFSDIQKNNPESDFNDIMIKLVQFIMTGNN